MDQFTPLSSTIGGLIIGAASAGLLFANGRIAGISGIAGGVLKLGAGDTAWRGLFVLGLCLGGFVCSLVVPEAFAFGIERSGVALALAGVLVGFGTQMGNGCTSGHGVCGLGRLSFRSLVAVITFMATAAATIAIIGHAFGGAL